MDMANRHTMRRRGDVEPGGHRKRTLPAPVFHFKNLDMRFAITAGSMCRRCMALVAAAAIAGCVVLPTDVFVPGNPEGVPVYEGAL